VKLSPLAGGQGRQRQAGELLLLRNGLLGGNRLLLLVAGAARFGLLLRVLLLVGFRGPVAHVCDFRYRIDRLTESLFPRQQPPPCMG
jgi:hypothetical protein